MRNKDNVVEKKVYHLVHTRMYEELIGKSNEECTPVDYYEAIEVVYIFNISYYKG